MKIKRSIILITTANLILLSAGIIIAWNNPASVYEISIYSTTPFVFWLALAINTLCGIGITVYQVYTKGYDRDNTWALGFLLIFLAYISFYSLYIIRGYIYYGGSGDVASHIGATQYILANNHIPPQDIYPVSHILVAQLSQVLGINIMSSSGYVPVLFNSLYPIFIYIFVKALSFNKGQIVLATLASTTMVFGWWNIYLAPNQLAFLFLPLALFLFAKSVRTRSSGPRLGYRILFGIMLFLLPMFHPVPALVLLIIVATLSLPRKIYGLFSTGSEISRFDTYPINPAASIFFALWFVTWISSFYVWKQTILNIQNLIMEGASTNAQALSQNIGYAQQYGYDVVEQFLRVYGGIAIYIILALIAFFIIRKKIRQDSFSEMLFSWYGPLAVCVLAVIGLYFSNTVITGSRIMPALVLISTPLTGFLFYEMLMKARLVNQLRIFSRFLIGGVASILIVTIIFGATQAYPSPYTLMPNDQTTRSEADGVSWYFKKKNSSILSLEITSNLSRFADILLTPQEIAGRKDIRSNSETSSPNWHFGYGEYEKLGQQYSTDRYLVINQLDRVLYTELFPGMAKIRFQNRDFQALGKDASVNKIYDDTGFNAYYIVHD